MVEKNNTPDQGSTPRNQQGRGRRRFPFGRRQHSERHGEQPEGRKRNAGKQILNILREIRTSLRPTRRWKTLFQFIIPAITGFLTLIVLVLQWRTYRGQLAEMKRTSDATVDAANAAKDSVTHAKDSAHLDQRAWIGVMALDGAPEVDKPYTVKVTFKNTGRTFGNAVSVITVVRFEPNWSIVDFDEAEASGKTVSSGLVPPEGTCFGTVTFDHQFSDIELGLIETGEWLVYVHGKLTYEDIFKCPHFITFCYTLSGDRKAGFSYQAYWTHNKADENRCP